MTHRKLSRPYSEALGPVIFNKVRTDSLRQWRLAVFLIAMQWHFAIK